MTDLLLSSVPSTLIGTQKVLSEFTDMHCLWKAGSYLNEESWEVKGSST